MLFYTVMDILYVDPAHNRRGMGKSLIEHVIKNYEKTYKCRGPGR